MNHFLRYSKINITMKKKFAGSVTGSSNFGKFIKLFESDDSRWIEKINMQIEE